MDPWSPKSGFSGGGLQEASRGPPRGSPVSPELPIGQWGPKGPQTLLEPPLMPTPLMRPLGPYVGLVPMGPCCAVPISLVWRCAALRTHVGRLQARVSHELRPARGADAHSRLDIGHSPLVLAVVAESRLERAEVLLEIPTDVGLP